MERLARGYWNRPRNGRSLRPSRAAIEIWWIGRGDKDAEILVRTSAIAVAGGGPHALGLCRLACSGRGLRGRAVAEDRRRRARALHPCRRSRRDVRRRDGEALSQAWRNGRSDLRE